ncbi:MAG: hypothetical protein KatS3mg102_1623 [Planctomycetota bacterium]|nr:MAG: hypothetical protein KatS3mg102_1623 [Planctomycetota bacterium]
MKAVYTGQQLLLPLLGVLPGAPAERRQRPGLPPPPLGPIRPAPPVARPLVDIERRRRPPVVLGTRARRSLGVLARAIAPDADLGIADLEGWTICYVSRFAAYLPPPLGRALGPVLAALEWLPLVVGPRRRRLSRLSRAECRSFLQRLLDVRGLVREAVHGLRGLLALALYEHPAAHRAIGYAAQRYLQAKARERQQRFGAPEPW